MMDTTYVGMDAHAASIRVAVLRPGAGPAEEWQLVNEPRGVKRLARGVTGMAAGPVLACYEAGPCGFARQRQLQAEGLRCQVIAPALIPRRPGDRVKTDRRDARQLAELLRAELRTVVHPPTPDQEAVRDLCRARADAVADRTRGAPPPGEAAATARHRLRRPELDAAPPPLAADAAFRAPPPRRPPATTTCARWRAWRSDSTRRVSARRSGNGGPASPAGRWRWPTGCSSGSIGATGGWLGMANLRPWRTSRSRANWPGPCGPCCGSTPSAVPRPDTARRVGPTVETATGRVRSGGGWMGEGTMRRMRGTAMRQRRLAPSTRDPRRRSLPAKHDHAASTCSHKKGLDGKLRASAARRRSDGTPSHADHPVRRGARHADRVDAGREHGTALRGARAHDSGGGRGPADAGDCGRPGHLAGPGVEVAHALWPRSAWPGCWMPPGRGSPAPYGPATAQRVLAQLAQVPAAGHASWTGEALATALGDVSVAYVRRVLRAHGIHLQRRRSWCVSTDPEFAPKAAAIVGLYLNPPRQAVVLCVDEKPHIQALERAQGWLRFTDGRALTGFSHHYKRHGTTTLFGRARGGDRPDPHPACAPPPQLPGLHERTGRSLSRAGVACVCSTTSTPTSPRTTAGCATTPASTSTSRPPTRPGSTRSSAGSAS